jgi:hypothetical protein
VDPSLFAPEGILGRKGTPVDPILNGREIERINLEGMCAQEEILVYPSPFRCGSEGKSGASFSYGSGETFSTEGNSGKSSFGSGGRFRAEGTSVGSLFHSTFFLSTPTSKPQKQAEVTEGKRDEHPDFLQTPQERKRGKLIFFLDSFNKNNYLNKLFYANEKI